MLRARIVTDRLVLRPHVAADAAAVCAGIGDLAVARMLTGPPWPYALSDAEAFIAARPAARASGEMYAYAIEAEGALVGTISLSALDRYPDVAPGALELGYWLAASHWGRGCATEAGRALLAAADEDLGPAVIVSAHFIENAKSRHVLEKLGFHNAGVIRSQFARSRGEEVDVQPMIRPAQSAAQPAAAFAGRSPP